MRKIPWTETTAMNWHTKVIRFLHLWNCAHWRSRDSDPAFVPTKSLFWKLASKSSIDIFSSNGSLVSIFIDSSFSDAIEILFKWRPSRNDANNPTSFRKQWGSGWLSSNVAKYEINLREILKMSHPKKSSQSSRKSNSLQLHREHIK